MIVSSLKTSEPTLWPAHSLIDLMPIKTFAETRNHCGDVAEELTAVAFGARRHKTDGTANYCPDLSTRRGEFIESKSVGGKGSSIIYSSRAEKDEAFNESHPLFYVWWRHDCDAKGAATIGELRRRMIGAIRYGIVLDLAAVLGVLASRKPRVLNKEYAQRNNKPLGYGNRSKGYGVGFSVPLSEFYRSCDRSIIVPPVMVYGIKTGVLKIGVSQRSANAFYETLTANGAYTRLPRDWRTGNQSVFKFNH